MKIDDFMDALGNVDPKYIEESAVELNEASMENIIAFRRKKAAKRRRIWTGCISAAACLILVIMVNQTGFLERTKNTKSKNEYMEAPSSHSSSAAQAEEMSEEPVYDDYAESIVMESSYDESMGDRLEAEQEPQSAIDSGMSATENNSDSVAIMPEEALDVYDMTNVQEGSSVQIGIEEEDVVWESADCFEHFKEVTFEEITGSTGTFTCYELKDTLDINGLSVYDYGHDELVFARDILGTKLYAYYERDNTGYLIVGEYVKKEDFIEGVEEILGR